MKCTVCARNVLLEDAVRVLPAGVNGQLIVKCWSCSEFIRVAMDKTHSGKGDTNTGPKIFDVNTKLATAMYHIGIGPTQLKNFLSVLNLPMPASKTIQRRCEEVGSTLERLACESTDKALQREVELSTEVSPLLMCADQSTGISVTDSPDQTVNIGAPAQDNYLTDEE
ncbi:uncharacterized protein LOC134254553, partial [Saccostrea cucullata]|uniref:uncharacterized protein LOC134254553 n=1 Tax=Saccostrea cuccullata TaxID=36930 RepID=UPI002ED5F3A6